MVVIVEKVVTIKQIFFECTNRDEDPQASRRGSRTRMLPNIT